MVIALIFKRFCPHLWSIISLIYPLWRFCRIEKPLSTVQGGSQGRPGGRVPTNRSRGQAVFYLDGLSWTICLFCFKYVFRILVSIRPISWFRFREVALAPTVLSLHMGKWNLSASAPADAQHWGAAGVSGPDTEDGSDQVGTSDYMGGWCWCNTLFALGALLLWFSQQVWLRTINIWFIIFWHLAWI